MDEATRAAVRWPTHRSTPPVDLRTDIPHSARMYDYFLGGKDNFPADREAAEHLLAVYPATRTTAVQGRAFMTRAVRHLARDAGIHQFLDIGTGIPTSSNLHETAQAAVPAARVLYVDNDPIVLSHARALLTSTPRGRTAYLDADLLDPGRIIRSAELRDTFDLDRPVALSLFSILHFVPDDQDPAGIVRELLGALAPGSYLAITHATGDFVAPEVAELGTTIYQDRGIPFQPRSHAEITALLDGLEPVAPGLVPVHRWHPEDEGEERLADAEVSSYGAIARKPPPGSPPD
ncbi:SAM-dependent methyltransferase [Parafrankia discariae]|uniref:SAM-dependent methyltransferase n=1 Tax=Parafrankia discariae TaxID=365528 RepID=UPI0006849BAB|nr:SAM-dependent methyltransferase [Parafrankia discariae]